jgi:hypothetical protein
MYVSYVAVAVPPKLTIIIYYTSNCYYKTENYQAGRLSSKDYIANYILFPLDSYMYYIIMEALPEGPDLRTDLRATLPA